MTKQRWRAVAIAYALVPITLFMNPSRIIGAGPLAPISAPFAEPLIAARRKSPARL